MDRSDAFSTTAGEAAGLAILGALPDVAVFVLDRDLRVVQAAGGALADHGLDAAALAGRPLEEALPGVGRAAFVPRLRAALEEPQDFDLRTRAPRRTYAVAAAPAAGGAEGVVVVARDVTALRAPAAPSRPELTDPVTGLANRRAFDAALDEQVLACRDGGERASLFVLDVSGLGQISDCHGQGVSGAIMRAIGEVLVGYARTSDVVARIGESEFALLLPGAGDDVARAIADDAVARIRRMEVDGLHAVPPCFGIGAGICPLDGPDADAASVLARADAQRHLQAAAACRAAPRGILAAG
jgi:diguanylate cyclase (GGDEF)-like protein